MELTPVDLYLLSDRSNCHLVVKTGILKDAGRKVLDDVVHLYGYHEQNPVRNIFQLAGIGSTTKGIKDSTFRGDYRCWVSTGLCDDFKLFGVKSLISNIVAMCKGKLGVEHRLNGHYSIQAALYVSHSPV